MTADSFIFWFLALVTIVSGLSVILMTNPIYSALSLAMTMVSVAALFVTLQSYFLASVQMIVYAGAVMVLFVMVLMLFDLKNELQAFSRGKIKGAFKIGAVGIFSGLVAGAGAKAFLNMNSVEPAIDGATNASAIRPLAENLFFKHVFEFEALGVLLLVVAVGTVAYSRSKGGTHDKH